MELPTKNFDLVLQACDPAEPLQPGDRRYAEFSTLRQGESLSRLIAELRIPQSAGYYYHRCLCGHRGTGKSTELLTLKKWADEHHYMAAFTEVQEQLGLIDLEFSDLFLLAATTVETTFKKVGYPVDEAILKEIVDWFSEVTKQTTNEVNSELAVEVGAQIGGKIPLSLGGLFAKFSAGVQAASQHAHTIRRVMRNYPSTLIELTNKFLMKANETLAEKGLTNGILLIFDNLDRYDPQQVNHLLFSNSELIQKLACHCVFTIPISLEYDSLSGTSQDCYGFPVVLPMLSLRDRKIPWAATVEESRYNNDAISIVREALSKRIEIDALFENKNDADLLIKMSGGCIRDLMHLVKNAHIWSATSGKFTPQGVQQGIHRMRATYARRLTPDDYQRLADIAHRLAVPRDEQTKKLLYNRWALEYLDQNNDPWIDIHPLTLEIEEFHLAYERHKQIVPPTLR